MDTNSNLEKARANAQKFVQTFEHRTDELISSVAQDSGDEVVLKISHVVGTQFQNINSRLQMGFISEEDADTLINILKKKVKQEYGIAGSAVLSDSWKKHFSVDSKEKLEKKFNKKYFTLFESLSGALYFKFPRRK